MGINNHASHEKESALTDGVVAAGEVVRGILLTGDQLLRVEQLTVRTRADLVNHRRLQVDEDAARHMLSGTRLREEGVERIISSANGPNAEKMITSIFIFHI